MEDGREIFDDDLDDDVVEKNKGNHSYNIVTQQFMCILRLSVVKYGVNSFVQGVNFFVFAGKAGAKGADSKKNMKKSVVAKPNTIKSLFMNSNVKRPAEVCLCRHHVKTVPCADPDLK